MDATVTVRQVKSLLVAAALVAVGCASKAESVRPDSQPGAAPMTHQTRAFTAELVDEGAPRPPGVSRRMTVVGARVRMEMKLGDRHSVQIFRGKGQPLLVLDPANKTYAELPPSPIFEAAATAMDVPNLENPCAAWRAPCTRVGEADVDGRKVTKWTTTSRDGATVTLFVDETLFHLLRIEEGNAVKTLRDVRIVTPDEAWFAVPDGYTQAPPR